MRATWVGYGAAVVALATMSIAHAETITVTIDKVAYGPVSVSAHVGDTIAWVNKDIVAHTATARQAMGPDDIAKFNEERGAQACRQDRLLLQVSSQYDRRHFRRINCFVEQTVWRCLRFSF